MPATLRLVPVVPRLRDRLRRRLAPVLLGTGVAVVSALPLLLLGPTP